MSALVDLPVDHIITDDGQTLIAVFKERAEMGPVQQILLGMRKWLAH
jgi:hypothetical protein